MTEHSPRVVKLGGSLLGLPDLRCRVDSWFRANPHPLNLIVVGGGELVESIRRLHDQHHLPDSFAHWMCIDLLEQTAKLAEHLFPKFLSIATAAGLEQLVASPSPRGEAVTAVVSVRAFYSRHHCDQELPQSWDTTSDALAALLAKKTHAKQLVLLKSTAPSNDRIAPHAWSQQGLVDQAFPAIARSLPQISIVNLRRWRPAEPQ